MKKFKFRLEKVLQYREIVKGEKKRELSLKLAILREAEDKLDALFKAQAENNMPDGGTVNANVYFLRGQFATRVKEAIVRQRLVIIEAEKQVEVARNIYIEASREVKTLEMLKAKKQEQYMEYVKDEEAKFLDEIVTQRAARGMGLD